MTAIIFCKIYIFLATFFSPLCGHVENGHRYIHLCIHRCHRKMKENVAQPVTGFSNAFQREGVKKRVIFSRADRRSSQAICHSWPNLFEDFPKVVSLKVSARVFWWNVTGCLAISQDFVKTDCPRTQGTIWKSCLMLFTAAASTVWTPFSPNCLSQ